MSVRFFSADFDAINTPGLWFYDKNLCTIARYQQISTWNRMQNFLMRIGPPDLFLPGLVVGCWPLNGLRMSTLECFYSSTCINTILNYLNYFTDINGSPPENFTFPEQLPLQIDPLKNLTSSRFPLYTTIDQIMDQLFIEEYINQSSYENDYNACSPSVCRYEHINRNSLLYVITSILSLYGGLTISLRFFIWNFLRIYKYIQYHCNIRRTTPVQPFTIQL